MKPKHPGAKIRTTCLEPATSATSDPNHGLPGIEPEQPNAPKTTASATGRAILHQSRFISVVLHDARPSLLRMARLI